MTSIALDPGLESSLGIYEPVPNKSFSGQNPYLQTTWDSTSLGTFKECPWKYFLANICGWNPKAQRAPLEFGIQYHAALELWDKLLANGMSKASAAIQVVQCAGWRGGFIPEGDTARTSETLVRAVVWYIDQFHGDKAETVILANGKPAVELSFLFPFHNAKVESSPIQFYLAGHIDRLVNFQGTSWFMDRKTTKSGLDQRYFAQFSPDNQMDLYTLASQVIFETPCAGGIIDAAQLGVNYVRFKRQEIQRTPEQIDEWVEDTKLWIETAATCAARHQWPKNDKSCDKYGGCQFRPVCSKSPSVREVFLKADFRRKIWDPSTAR